MSYDCDNCDDSYESRMDFPKDQWEDERGVIKFYCSCGELLTTKPAQRGLGGM